MKNSTRLLRSFSAGFSAVVIAFSAHAQTVITTNTTPGLFDASSGTRVFNFAAADTGIITDVNISIHFAKADGETFEIQTGTPFYNETVFNLSYGGNTTALISPNSFNVGNGPGFSGTINFDDSAASIVNVDPSLIQAGTFRPVGSLAVFNGLTLTPENWTLSIQDTTGGDALRFYSATIEVTYQGTGLTAVPEPSTYGLMGAAVLVGAIWMRRRAKIANA